MYISEQKMKETLKNIVLFQSQGEISGEAEKDR